VECSVPASKRTSPAPDRPSVRRMQGWKSPKAFVTMLYSFAIGPQVQERGNLSPEMRGSSATSVRAVAVVLCVWLLLPTFCTGAIYSGRSSGSVACHGMAARDPVHQPHQKCCITVHHQQAVLLSVTDLQPATTGVDNVATPAHTICDELLLSSFHPAGLLGSPPTIEILRV